MALPRPLTLLALALLAVALPGCGESAPPPTPTPPLPAGPRTVLLVSIDTLRPARLGVYGNTDGGLPVSPRIDALAGEAVVFDQALAPSPWTLPSHMTMLTGLDPVAHAIHNEAYAPLSAKVTTLAEALRQEGFATAAFTDGGFVSGRYGFDDGFDVYEDARNPPDQGPNGFARLLPAALEWLEDKGPGDEDLFLFVHTFDVHAPFAEGDQEVLGRFRQRPVKDGLRDWGLNIISWYYQQRKMGLDRYLRMGDLLNDYDAGVFEADRGVGALLDVLSRTGRADSAMVIVTSDHGESFFDHELHVGHGLGLGDDELRVPLVVRFPTGEGAGSRRPELVGLVDVARTVLDAMEIPAPDEMQGESLLQLVRGRPRKLDYVLGASQNTRSLFLVRGGFKYVSPAGVLPNEVVMRHLGPMSPPCPDPAPDSLRYSIGSGDEEVELTYDFVGDPLGVLDTVPRSESLYDRRSDPNERANLVREQPEMARRMREYLLALYEQSDALASELFDPEADTPGTDAASQKVMAALGYLATGSKEAARGMSKHLRDEVRHPHEPLAIELLVEGDRAVQAVRARLAAGEPLGEAERDELQNAGLKYRLWYEDNSAHLARVSWRMAALLELAQTAGLQLDTARLLARRPAAGTRAAGDAPPQPDAPPGDDGAAAAPPADAGAGDPDEPPSDGR